MVTCVQKPYVVIASGDKTVRIWNYINKNCEVIDKMSEEVVTLDIHPSGLQLVIGSKEKVRICNVFVDRLPLFQDLGIKYCKYVKYSHGGQYIAIASGINVLVYRTYDLTCIGTFTGHIQPSKQIVWAEDDCYIFSCGNDGGVYGWDIHSKQRVDDMCYVSKDAEFSSLAVCCKPLKNQFETVLVGLDGYLRVRLNNGDVFKYEIKPYCLSQILLSKDRNFLFTGTFHGTIRIYNFVELLKGEISFNEFPVYTSETTVTHLLLVGDRNSEEYLYSAGSDGSVFVHIINYESDMVKLQENTSTSPSSTTVTTNNNYYNYNHYENNNHDGDNVSNHSISLLNSDAVLASKDSILSQLNDISDLKKKLKEMENRKIYELKNERVLWASKLEEQRECFIKDLKRENIRYEALQTEHIDYVKGAMQSKQNLERENQRIIQEIENRYEHKLALEMERYDALSEEMETFKQVIEVEQTKEVQKYIEENKDLRDKYNASNTAQSEMIQSLEHNLELNEVKFKEIIQQQSTEYEIELQQAREKSKRKLEEVGREFTKRDGQLLSQQNTIDELKQAMTKLNNTNQQSEQEYKNLHGRYSALKVTLKHYENHLEERKLALTEKERNLLTLRSQNRTLDNFRFVLDNRIHQLTGEQGPTLDHISKLEKHIDDIHDELVSEYNQKKDTASVLVKKDLKIESLTGDIAQLRTRFRDGEQFITAFLRDLEASVKCSQVNEYEEALTDLYNRYCCNNKYGSHHLSQMKLKKKRVNPATTSSTEGELLDNNTNDDEDKALNVHSILEAKNVIQELVYQRDFTVRNNLTMKKSLNRAMLRSTSDARTAMGDNSVLINECNCLRKENRKLQNKIAELKSSIKSMKRMQKSTNNSTGEATTDARMDNSIEGGSSSNKFQYISNNNKNKSPITSKQSPVKLRKRSLKHGRKLSGNTLLPMTNNRQQLEFTGNIVSDTDAKTVRMKKLLESNYKEISIQREEIKKLRLQLTTTSPDS